MYLIQSQEARRAIAVGRQNHWRFRVVGHEDMPVKPILKSGWLLEPTNKYSIPFDLQSRVLAIKRAGIATQGVIIAHEAPRLLAAPKKPKINIQDVGKGIAEALEVTTEVLGAIFGEIGLLLLFAPLLFLDPAIIVVLEDGTWIEVVRWYE